MKYEDIVLYIKLNFPELDIYHSSIGSCVGDGITIDWEMQEEKATYCTAEFENGNTKRFIVMGDFKNKSHKKLALLHELGHHTSDQNGGVLEREMNVWSSCFNWFNKLNIILTDNLKIKALTWFYSYVNEYGLTKQVSSWLNSNGLSYEQDVNKAVDKYKSNRKIDIKPIWGYESWKFKY